MNEPLDPLEAELSALTPCEASPGLRLRIAGRLAEATPARPRRMWRAALGVGLAATPQHKPNELSALTVGAQQSAIP